MSDAAADESARRREEIKRILANGGNVQVNSKGTVVTSEMPSFDQEKRNSIVIPEGKLAAGIMMCQYLSVQPIL